MVYNHAPRAWYETLSTTYLKMGFEEALLDMTCFIRKVNRCLILLVQVYVDDIIFGSTKKYLCVEFEQMMHKRFQMSSIGKLTFFVGLQVKHKDDGIFISQDKYVADILKKFDFVIVKTASTPIETNKALLKDEEAEDMDVHLYRSMIGSLMYLTASRLDIMFAVCACARFQVTPKVLHIHAVKRIFRYLKGQPKLGLWYPRDSPFDMEAFSDSDYAGASLDRKSITGGCQFLSKRFQVTPKVSHLHDVKRIFRYLKGQPKLGLWYLRDSPFDLEAFSDSDYAGASVDRKSTTGELGEGSGQPTDPQHISTSAQLSNGEPITSSGPIHLVADETVIKEWEDRMERATTTASSLEAKHDSGNINKTQSMVTLNESFPQGTNSGSGPRCQDTILRVSKLKLVYAARHTLPVVRHKLMLPDITYYGWESAKAKIINGERQIQALVDKKKVIITERHKGDLKLADAERIDLVYHLL
ncbi:putative ribonuclease H-like domain-containing protein [Tanacetum coccineum]|uniref:Ribonuclease H-like domain-containing protein n=1 Tax=Tanacetum coccineum TaxID=301880 RepID=A0ABQ5I5U8_9ASTR